MIVQNKGAQDSIPEPRVPRGGVGQDQFFLKNLQNLFLVHGKKTHSLSFIRSPENLDFIQSSGIIHLHCVMGCRCAVWNTETAGR